MNISDRLCDSLIATCEEVGEYLDDHADVRDGDDGRPTPNKAMSLGTHLGEVCAQVKAARAKLDPSQALADALRGSAMGKGWAILHTDGKRWRTMDSIGMPDWTTDPRLALVCRVKEHTERYAEDDHEDVRIVEVDW